MFDLCHKYLRGENFYESLISKFFQYIQTENSISFNINLLEPGLLSNWPFNLFFSIVYNSKM